MARTALSLMMGAFLAGSVTAAAAAPERSATAPLSYQLTEGDNLNAFFREGKVAAHLLLRSGVDPRILVAFPAGNSGVGLWFEPLAEPAVWTLDDAPVPRQLTDSKRRTLYGIRTVASITTPRLVIKQAVLSNVRYLRDYQAIGKFPPQVATPVRIAGDTISFARDRIDGAPGYKLAVKVVTGRIEQGAILAGRDGRISLEITAATGDMPLTGISGANLLNAKAARDPLARDALRFLSYREKFLAGSWRFDTYFGRDTLMSVRLLMPVLRPPAIEAGLSAVLARLSKNGEVAHEEGLSEFAILDRRAHGEQGDAPTLDYTMVDSDFMLAPVMAHYLLEKSNPIAANTYLARAIPGIARPGTSETAGAALIRNLRYVVAQAKEFVDDPQARNLVSLKPGRMTGEWRDSNEGIGRGRYPYDVNAVFVPAALDAAVRMMAARLLEPYLSDEDRAMIGRAKEMAKLWRQRAPLLFRVSAPSDVARPAIDRYAADLGIPAAPALAALGNRPIVFNAISLDANGAPVPVINSDEGFALLFSDPSPANLDTFVTSLMRPFPAGLMTPIGLLVANPVLTGKDVQARFTPAAYHGTVVWSWQQALFAAGLERQLTRSDLPAETRQRLTQAQTSLWRVIEATRMQGSSELWSWAYDGGRYRVVPFGAGKQDVDESNAAQLWSTVYLAVQPPKTMRPTGKR